MSESGEVRAKLSPMDQLGIYVAAETDRMNAAWRVLAEGLDIVVDTEEVNRRLVEAGRADLVIEELAAMHRATHVNDIHAHNNFTPRFQITTGYDEQPATNSIGEPVVRTSRVPVTRAELLALRSGRRTFQDVVHGHTEKPAYERMLVLFPEFTIEFDR